MAGNRIKYDARNPKGNDWTPGLGLRVTAGGHRSFIFNYRTKSGRARRLTIGSPPAWSIGAAREEARSLKRLVDQGHDPLAGLKADRDAPTVSDLCQRFEDEYIPKKREATQTEYKSMMKNKIKPELGSLKVSDVTYSDVDRLHRKLTKLGHPYRANRTIAVLSKMFSLAIKWQYRSDNPAKGIERNQEQKRERYLSGDELVRLSKALAKHKEKNTANIIRLLLLTGARSGEMMAARWNDFDLENGVWTKPGSTTKQKTFHRVPLSAPARQILSVMRKDAKDDAEFLFAGRGSAHRVDLKKAWPAICKAAGLSNARVHDLRHTYASILASAGQSLPIIGALLGHSQPATTARYAHLLDDPLRQATERVGSLVAPSKQTANVVKIR